MKKYSQFVDESISFKINDQLNSKFWNKDKLKPDVSKHLKKIADAWTKFVGLKKSDVQDILFLGGNAGYNYTKYSDLDLHIVVDIKNTIECPDLASEYYKDKRELWKLTHNAKIYGHDVEPYVEDVGKKRRKNQGVYSIKYKKWIVLPGKFTGEVDKDLLESKVRDMMVKIDRIVRSATNEQVLTELLSKIRDMRNAGLGKFGEFSFENLVFKELRNKGYIDKLADHILKLQDKSLTLENYVN
jgi:hypothetical protein